MFVKEIINFLCDPRILLPLVAVLFLLALRTRSVWTNRSGLIGLIGLLAFFAFSMTDANFRIIVLKPDNVPIVALIFLMSFFVWFSLKQAYDNDDRIARGEEVAEKSDFQQKMFTWPHLVYIELVALVLCTVLLIAWSVLVKAPLEQPANPAKTPNPSKAPWYFLGLQEMLVYFDPWIAGVVLPGIIIVGLMSIPFIDRNNRGSGYYTFKQRPFAITIFLFGFLILWVQMVVLGTFLRGPNWNFFGPYEQWDIHKLLPLSNVNLSEYIYVKWLGTGLPNNILVREMWGFLVVIAYFAALPPILSRTWLKKFYEQLGFVRYNVLVFLLLFMASLPIKMILRWTVNLKYIVAIPEFFFNI